MTKLNQEILEMIRCSDGHLSAEDAFLLAKKKNIDVSMASIYRILSKLAEDGYIRKISIPNQADIFDKTIENHEHLVCKVCGKVKDIHINNLEDVLIKATNLKKIDNYSLCIDYICDNCNKKN